MKILMQTDESCEFCNSEGVMRTHKEAIADDVNDPFSFSSSSVIIAQCKVCMGTGKKLKWIEVKILSNKIYIAE